MKTIDLHVHSCLSDGTCTPEELVALALKAGLSAFALTDHDTTEGIDRALNASEGTEVEVIPGIEFSTRWQHRDIHILGYFMDYHTPSFQQKVREYTEGRTGRNEKMCARIREYTGFPISLELLTSRWPDAVITRAHMASWLVEQGYVRDRNTAFSKYLGDHAPCFVPKEEVSPSEAVGLILDHGGVPVLAHPLLYALSRKQLNLLLEELTGTGLKGIETFYSMNHGNDEYFVRSLAHKYGLLLTGGSDFHGKNKPDITLGTGLKSNLSISYDILDGLRAARESHYLDLHRANTASTPTPVCEPTTGPT